MRHTVSRFIAAWAAVAALCLLAAAPAGATVTTSTLTVTSPQGSYLVDNQVYSDGEQITLGGTTDGHSGDKVDIKCFSDGGSMTLATAIPVDQSGAYSFSGSFRPISRQTCVLRAVRAGDATDYPPGTPSPYSGPLLNIGQQAESRVVGGSNGGDLEYYYLYASQPAGAFEYASLGGCSISESYLYDPTTFGSFQQFAGESIDFCNAWFSWANGGTKPGEAAPTRSELQVDAVNAYVAGNAWAINGLSTAANPGFPSLKYSYTIDPATGDLSLNETDQVVRCSPGGFFPPRTLADCSSFVPTGVQVTMQIVQTQSGRVARVVQWFQSVDGAAHTIDLLENNDFYQRNLDGQLDFPWTGAGMQPYTTAGQVLPGPVSPGPGAFFARGSASTPDGSEASPQGQVTFSTPPSSETIVAGTNSSQHFSWVDLHYSRTIPAGGSVPLGFTYSSAYSGAQVAFDAAAAEAAFRPTVSISWPQSGIDTAQRAVTVAGVAGDGTGLSGVTVNGQAAAVGDGGAWSAPVSLAPGLNTITVVATNVFGNTAQAQSAVVYVPPPALIALRQAHRRWREGGRRRAHGRHRMPVGTTFSWTLNEPAELQFVFTEQVPGRRGAGGACVAPNSRNRRHGRCLRTITLGAHTLSAGAGAGRWAFGGVMAGGRRLAPGTYTVTIVATTPATGVQSAPARLHFTIVH